MKAAIITGASSGIGSATAKRLHEHGYFVYLIARNESRLKELNQSLNNSKYYLCDFTSATEIPQVANLIKSDLHNQQHQLISLINNAGIYQLDRHQPHTENIWLDQFQVNLFSHVQLTNALIEELAKAKGASIVNVSSTLGLQPTADTAAYSASKAAMNSWTISLAQALGKKKIRVNAVCPGIVDTPIHQFHQLAPKEKEKALDSMADLQPLGRIGTPDDIAQSIYFLASEQSAWTTGTLLSVDGGIHIA